MVGLYWISVLNNLSIIFLIIGSILLGIFGVIAIVSSIEDREYDDTFPSKTTKRFGAAAIAGMTLLLTTAFIPSKQDMYLIWGVGSTIDYLKSDDTAKQLPDKVIQALDKWVDSFSKDEKQANKEDF